MPRQAKPRWHAARERWYMAVGPVDERGWASEVYAPVTIGRDDEAGAWEWFRGWRRRQERPATPLAPSVGFAVLRYLCDAAERVDEGLLAPAHLRAKKSHLRLFSAEFGKRSVAELRQDDVEQWLERLDRSAHYRADIAATVTAMARWAAKHGLFPGGQTFTVRAPVLPKKAERFATRSEAAVWLWWLWRVAKRHEMALLQRVLIRTGARPGEICEAAWGDVRWDAGRTSTGASYAKIVLPRDRWKAGRATGEVRTIYLTPALTRALRRRWPGNGPGVSQAALFRPGGPKARPDVKDRWESGSRLSAAIRRWRRRLMRDAGSARTRLEAGTASLLDLALLAVEWVDDGPQRVANYRWRHTAASSLLMLGLSAETVGALVGTSAEMIRSTYGHLLDEHLARAAEQLHDVGRTSPRQRTRP